MKRHNGFVTKDKSINFKVHHIFIIDKQCYSTNSSYKRSKMLKESHQESIHRFLYDVTKNVMV